jgi:hydroxymethylbilane synthase
VSARELVVGTRGSALAMAQTRIVCDALRRLDSSLLIHVERITTKGDTRSDAPISALGRGAFVTELESALRERRIDFAVHSAKDLPSTLDSDLTLAAILPRADARDVLVSRAGTLRELPRGARVGTSSPRRTCQLRALRSDLDLKEMRGNVDTRLRKLAAGEYDALVLAAAGLIRLGREIEVTEWLDLDTMIPCVGQGALAVETRADDPELLRLFARLDDPATRTTVTAERAFLAELGAGCLAAAAAHADVHEGRVRIVALIGSTDGRYMTRTRTGNAGDAEHVGSTLARALLREGAAVFLATRGSSLTGVRVAVTRPSEQSEELMALLRARGAQPVCCPTIAIEPVGDGSVLDEMLGAIGSADWMVFTSANAVRIVAGRLRTLKLPIPPRLRFAAVGGATADALAVHLRPPDFVSTTANAAALAAQLPEIDGAEVVFAHGDLAQSAVDELLRNRGARVRTVVAYHTVPGSGIEELRSRIASGELDAVVFASPSSVRFAADALANARAIAGSLPLIVCIGPTTALAARECGLQPNAVATSQSVGGIVEALEQCMAARGATPQAMEH